MSNTAPLSAGGWVDVTRTLHAGNTHWPGDPPFSIERISDLRKGDPCNVSAISLCTHTGTHMDAPLHYLGDGDSIDAAPLDALMGPARVVQCEDPVSIRRDWLEGLDIQTGERLIFKTHATDETAAPATEAPTAVHADNGLFRKDYVYVALDAAEFLAERKTRLVGIDTMSVGGYFNHMTETHVALLSANCWIVENLDLLKVTPGRYEVICLPLKIENSDGAPARVLLRRLD